MGMSFWGVSICPFFQRCDQNRGMKVHGAMYPQRLTKLRASASWFEHHLGNDSFQDGLKLFLHGVSEDALENQ